MPLPGLNVPWHVVEAVVFAVRLGLFGWTMIKPTRQTGGASGVIPEPPPYLSLAPLARRLDVALTQKNPQDLEGKDFPTSTRHQRLWKGRVERAYDVRSMADGLVSKNASTASCRG